MIDTASQRRTGIVLVLAAAVAWSTAPFFTRLLALLDSWTILFWRGLSGATAITVVLVRPARCARRSDQHGEACESGRPIISFPGAVRFCSSLAADNWRRTTSCNEIVR